MVGATSARFGTVATWANGGEPVAKRAACLLMMNWSLEGRIMRPDHFCGPSIVVPIRIAEAIMAHPVDSAIATWQAENHELGMIQFSTSDTVGDLFPYYHLPAGTTFLGLMEADALCLMNDGRIVVYDHEVDRVLCEAAPTQSAFLNALAVLQQYFQQCAADEKYCDDESARIAARVRASEVAGGDRYTSFFSMMVGA